MTEVTEEALAEVFDGIMTRSRDELRDMRQEDLESFWFFRYDESCTPERNLYQFQDMLHLYSRKCRQWEEMHKGHMCVVERVRDTYLMPKIREFAGTITRSRDAEIEDLNEEVARLREELALLREEKHELRRDRDECREQIERLQAAREQ